MTVMPGILDVKANKRERFVVAWRCLQSTRTGFKYGCIWEVMSPGCHLVNIGTQFNMWGAGVKSMRILWGWCDRDWMCLSINWIKADISAGIWKMWILLELTCVRRVAIISEHASTMTYKLFWDGLPLLYGTFDVSFDVAVEWWRVRTDKATDPIMFFSARPNANLILLL